MEKNFLKNTKTVLQRLIEVHPEGLPPSSIFDEIEYANNLEECNRLLKLLIESKWIEANAEKGLSITERGIVMLANIMV